MLNSVEKFDPFVILKASFLCQLGNSHKLRSFYDDQSRTTAVCDGKSESSGFSEQLNQLKGEQNC